MTWSLAWSTVNTKGAMMKRAKWAILGAFFCFGTAQAKIPSPPSAKPPVVYASEVVSTQDAAIVREAIRAADRRDWAQLRQLRQLARDEAVEDFVLWQLARAGTPAVGFDTLNEAMTRLSDWPRARSFRIGAEEAIVLSALSHEQRILWFDALGGPISGQGKAAYGESLRRTGSVESAYDYVRDSWRNHTINRATERDILARYPELLTQDDHRARVDYLLWTNQRGAANRLRSYLTADYKALVDARIALKWRGRSVDAKVAAVPDHLKEHAGLLFDRARWRRRRARNQEGATSLLVKIDGLDVPFAGRDNLWDERNIAIRASLKKSDYRTAYDLAAPHGLSSGADFADAEWIAGWIALRMLGEPEKAAAHFATLKKGVSTPISLSRADYWHGRALKELGAAEEAEAAFRSASVHNYAYYGQLAAEQIGEPFIALPATPEPTEAERDGFQDRSIVRVLRLLGEAGDRGLFRQFAFHLDDQLETPVEQLLLAEIGDHYHQPDVGVRGAKAGLGRGIIAPEAAYPVVSYPLRRDVRVENALVLALSRQESELNPRAISHANARGLMQLIPATARTQARREGLPFRVSWLTDDPGYNMTLGAAHLDDLLDQFNGSYIMTAAAYNAGPRRPKQWIIDYGDPRRGEIDPIDWVELIPFSETRNYVQRVLENVQVYRHRLSGEPGQISILSDLQRGRLL
ncbi:MAG: lytic transglycosylase domain-containing protein [Pseudomonadota bacterium]